MFEADPGGRIQIKTNIFQDIVIGIGINIQDAEVKFIRCYFITGVVSRLARTVKWQIDRSCVNKANFKSHRSLIVCKIDSTNMIFNRILGVVKRLIHAWHGVTKFSIPLVTSDNFNCHAKRLILVFAYIPNIQYFGGVIVLVTLFVKF